MSRRHAYLLAAVIALQAAPLRAADNAQTRQMQELQRDVAQLQELVKALQATVNEKLGGMQAEVQKSVETAAQAKSSVEAAQRSLENLLKEQESKLVPPMAALGSRMEQASTALTTMQQGMADLASSMTKLQTQVADLNQAVKVLQAPPAAPPSDGPGLPAADLFQNAEDDFHTGKLNLALQGYTQYLKWYSDTPLASEAQYRIGSIHQSQNDLEGALKDFDALLSTYPDSKKVPETLFYKGKVLMLLGRTAEANAAFRELRKRFPTSDVAKQAATIKPAGKQ